MLALLQVILVILDIAWWIIIASAILSWLYAFNIVNPRNQFVGTIGEFLYRLTEPVYRPIRNILPNFGGIDLSPLVVLLIIIFLQQFIVIYVAPAVLRSGLWPLILLVRLTPRAAHDRIDAVERGEGGQWHLEARVRAVPEKGLANKALVELVAKALGLAKSAVSLDVGARSRIKRLRVDGDETAITQRLCALRGKGWK